MRLLRALIVLVVLLAAGSAHAQAGDPPQLAKDLAAVAMWLGAKAPPKCTERCFVLTKLSLDGSVASGTLGFVLEGGVLAEHPVAVPLFGPPSKVRLEGVKDDDKPASVGFEGDHYFVVTANKRFTIRGHLSLDGDLALTIPGPLNTLEANLSGGRVVEGTKLSGLTSGTIHFDSGEGATKLSEPTVFQLSRAFRVARETGFEYRLVLRSGNDLGVVRLPLSFGEKVLEVSGSSGWKVEGAELVLPTAGHTASITVTGTVASAPARLQLDARSPYEWWLLESDAEHRIMTSTGSGHAKQLDSAESPIPRTQPSSRLFLAQRGEGLELTVQTLSATDALAAVVRSHARTAVLTARGEWVFDERLQYENNGVDHLMFAPAGRPIFLATDGAGERLMHKDGDLSKVLISLRKGTHEAHLQSLAETRLTPLFGVLSVPAPDHPLTASRAAITVGLPQGVIPLAVLGGDRIVWLVGLEQLAGVLVAAFVAWLVMSTARDRLLLGVGLAGLWLLSQPAFIATIGALLGYAALRIAARVLSGRSRSFVRIAIVAGAVLGVFITLVTLVTMSGRERALAPSPDRTTADYRPVDLPKSEPTPNVDLLTKGPSDQLKAPADESGKLGNYPAQLAAAGILPGVTPVALPLPSADRWVSASRELVTHDRPFAPRVVYVTMNGLLPLVAAWALSLLALAWLHRAQLIALRDRARALLAAPPPDAKPAE